MVVSVEETEVGREKPDSNFGGGSVVRVAGVLEAGSFVGCPMGSSEASCMDFFAGSCLLLAGWVMPGD